MQGMITAQKLRVLALRLRQLSEDALHHAGWLSFNVPIDPEFQSKIEPFAALLETKPPQAKKEVSLVDTQS